MSESTTLSSDRDSLIWGNRSGPAQETAQTAGLDNTGIVQLQNRIIGQQDQELEQMEETMNSTKVRVLCLWEYLFSVLQNRQPTLSNCIGNMIPVQYCAHALLCAGTL